MDYSSKALPNGCIVKLFVFQIPNNRTLARSNVARLIGKSEIFNVNSFPIDFAIEYEDTTTQAEEDDYTIYLNVYIEKNSTILFNNESTSQKEFIMTSKKNNITSNRLLLGSEYGDLIGRNGKSRRVLDVFLNTVTNEEN